MIPDDLLDRALDYITFLGAVAGVIACLVALVNYWRNKNE